MHHEQSVAVTFHIEEEYVLYVWDYLQANDIPAREPLGGRAIHRSRSTCILARPRIRTARRNRRKAHRPAAARSIQCWRTGRNRARRDSMAQRGIQGTGRQSGRNRPGVSGLQRPSGFRAPILCAGKVLHKQFHIFKPALKLCVRRPTRHSGDGSPLRDRARCLLLHIASSFERHGQKRRAVDGLAGRGCNQYFRALAVGRPRKWHFSIHR